MLQLVKKGYRRAVSLGRKGREWVRTRTDRRDSAPFLSADCWLRFADLAVTDAQSHDSIRRVLATVPCPTFFVETSFIFDYADEFLGSEHPYRLITTCNDDFSVPFQVMPPENPRLEEKMTKLLESRFLLRWYTKNPGIVHPKIQALPLGPKWQWRTTDFFGENKANHWYLYKKYGSDPARRFRDAEKLKTQLLYLNFRDTTGHAYFRAHTDLRHRAKQTLLKEFDWDPAQEFEPYFRTLARCKFCISPPGQGVDTHRTWEALMVGTIPIMLSTPLDGLFQGLPVVIVTDWATVTEEFLWRTYEDLRSRTYDFAPCYLPYWSQVLTQTEPGSFA